MVQTSDVYMLKKKQKRETMSQSDGEVTSVSVVVCRDAVLAPLRSLDALTRCCSFLRWGPDPHCAALRYPPTSTLPTAVVLPSLTTSVLCCRSSRLGERCIADQIRAYQSRLCLFMSFLLILFSLKWSILYWVYSKF